MHRITGDAGAYFLTAAALNAAAAGVWMAMRTGSEEKTA
jgi:hypothetical protein